MIFNLQILTAVTLENNQRFQPFIKTKRINLYKESGLAAATKPQVNPLGLFAFLKLGIIIFRSCLDF